MILRIFMVFPHVQKFEYFFPIEFALDLVNRAFFDLLPGLFNELQEPRIVLHRASVSYSNNIVCTGTGHDDSGRRNVHGVGTFWPESGKPAFRRPTSNSCWISSQWHPCPSYRLKNSPSDRRPPRTSRTRLVILPIRSGKAAAMRSRKTGCTLPESLSNTYTASTAPAVRARISSSGISSSFSPGITGAIEIPVGMPASASIFIAANRLSGDGTWGSTLRAVSASENGMLKKTRIDACSWSLATRSISLVTSADFVMIPTGFRNSAHT